jgi:hypothetical protein
MPDWLKLAALEAQGTLPEPAATSYRRLRAAGRIPLQGLPYDETTLQPDPTWSREQQQGFRDVVAEAKRQGVDPRLAVATAFSEGNRQQRFRHTQDGKLITSPAGAVGLMQVMPATGAMYGLDPTQYRQNIQAGVRHLKDNYERFGAIPALTFAAYNAGPGAVQEHRGIPPYTETQGYVQRALAYLGHWLSPRTAEAGPPAAPTPTPPPAPAGAAAPYPGASLRPDTGALRLRLQVFPLKKPDGSTRYTVLPLQVPGVPGREALAQLDRKGNYAQAPTQEQLLHALDYWQSMFDQGGVPLPDVETPEQAAHLANQLILQEHDLLQAGIDRPVHEVFQDITPAQQQPFWTTHGRWFEPVRAQPRPDLEVEIAKRYGEDWEHPQARVLEDLGIGLRQGTAAALRTVRNIPLVAGAFGDQIAQYLGLPSGGALVQRLEDALTWVAQQAEVDPQILASRETFADRLLQGIGAAAPGLVESTGAVALGGPRAGLAVLGALSAADRGKLAAAMEGLRYLLLGGVLERARTKPLAQRLALTSAAFGTDALTRTGSLQDAFISALIGAGLAIPGASPAPEVLQPIADLETWFRQTGERPPPPTPPAGPSGPPRTPRGGPRLPVPVLPPGAPPQPSPGAVPADEFFQPGAPPPAEPPPTEPPPAGGGQIQAFLDAIAAFEAGATPADVAPRLERDYSLSPQTARQLAIQTWQAWRPADRLKPVLQPQPAAPAPAAAPTLERPTMPDIVVGAPAPPEPGQPSPPEPATPPAVTPPVTPPAPGTRAPATFVGWQEQLPGQPPLALWNLTAPIPGHPTDSTVVTQTLREAGYTVEEPPLPPPTPAHLEIPIPPEDVLPTHPPALAAEGMPTPSPETPPAPAPPPALQLPAVVPQTPPGADALGTLIEQKLRELGVWPQTPSETPPVSTLPPGAVPESAPSLDTTPVPEPAILPQPSSLPSEPPPPPSGVPPMPPVVEPPEAGSPSSPAAPARPTYPDGRLIPQVGDEVYQQVPGFGGTPAYIYGTIRRGRGGQLRVYITGGASFIGSPIPTGRTYRLDPHWTVRHDPLIAQREADAEAQRQAERDAQEAEEQAQRAWSAAHGIPADPQQTNLPQDRTAVQAGDVLENRQGDRITVARLDPEYGWPLTRDERGEYTIGRIDYWTKVPPTPPDVQELEATAPQPTALPAPATPAPPAPGVSVTLDEAGPSETTPAYRLTATRGTWIDVVFPAQPPPEVRTRLKGMGFKWHAPIKGWRAKYVGTRLTHVRDLLREAFPETKVPPAAPETPAAASPFQGTGRGAVLPDVPPADPSTSAPPPPAPSGAVPTPLTTLIDRLAERLREGTMPTNIRELQAVAETVYGGTRGAGTFTPRDLYDAVEAALHQGSTATPGAEVSLAEALRTVEAIDETLRQTPTQTVRSAEQDHLQQFSTPLPYAYAVAWLAGLTPGDVVLEPSAGTGALATFAANAVGRSHVHVNEIAPRRLAILEHLGFTQRTSHDALYLHSLRALAQEAAPTVVLMNPPFSSAAKQHLHNPMVGARHVEEALKVLKPGGRLVAIVGGGMTPDAPRFAAWFRRMHTRYTLRANIGVAGAVYQKQGTTFHTRVLVFDKTGPTPDGTTVTGMVESLADLLRVGEGVRDGRAHVPSPGGASAPDLQTDTRPVATRREPAHPTDAVGAPAAGATPTAAPGGVPAPVPGDPGDVAPGGPAPVPAPPPRGGRPGGGRPAAAGGPARGPTSGSPGAPEPAAQPTPGVGPELSPAGEPPARGAGGLPPVVHDLPVEAAAPDATTADLSESLFEPYAPARLPLAGGTPHPGPLVQTAAMASVALPPATYRPALDPKVIQDGRLSLPQLEAVTYAGQAHTQMLPALEGQPPRRKGIYLGDGTGVGKGRESAGIIADNFAQGRRKAVWISEKQALIEDARRDWQGAVEGNPKQIVPLSRFPVKTPIALDEGIIFTTYSTLRGSAKDDKTITRVQQLVNWLGADFDGVLIFDEAHAMANNVTAGTGLTSKDASQQALAGLALQAALPQARVVYLSATGATEVSNLGYLERLGLWGPGTPFADKRTFIAEIAAGGIAAMELVARDMKALGLYLSRSLSYDGVEYDRVEAPLTAAQRASYNTLARAWQGVLSRVEEALQVTGGTRGLARAAAINRFWSSHQRFFNQIITAMQTPAMIRRIDADLARGDAAVIQLVNTNEAAQKEKLAQMQEGDDLEDLALTPLETLMQYVQNSFPVHIIEEYLDDNGNPATRLLLVDGQPVENPEAVQIRDRLIDDLAVLQHDIPNGPLEQILDHFGPEQVAEVTGRGERLVYRDDEHGVRRRVREKRTDAMTLAEAHDFMQDKRRILIFSDKGGTGRSYHADRTAINQRRRQHYVLQPGWRADKAVQGFGRTHRTNQASAPVFHLVTTDLPGQRRFVSSVARRLDQLGALTRGQRQATTQGLFAERDNLESVYAADALRQFFRDLVRGEGVSIALSDFEQQTGLQLRDPQTGGPRRETPDIRQFLNRLLSMTVESQEGVFHDFSQRLDQVIELAMQQGTFDVGVETLKADAIEKRQETVIATEPATGAETRHVELLVRVRRHPLPWTALAQRLAVLQRAGRANTGRLIGYGRNRSSGKLYAFVSALPTTDTTTGNVIARVRRVGVDGEDLLEQSRITEAAYELLDATATAPLWEQERAALPEFREHTEHLFTGALLPHWDKLPRSTAKVYRVHTTTGERLLGRVIPAKDLPGVLTNFGLTRTGASTTFALSPTEAVTRVLEAKSTLRLANGWRLKPSFLGGQWRVELTGPGSEHRPELDAAGVLFERIGFQPHWFLPTDARGPIVLGRVTETRAIVEEVPARRPD